MSKPVIDNAAYAAGVSFFNDGGSLKSVVDRIISEGGPDIDNDRKNMSFGLGFADALVERLRKL